VTESKLANAAGELRRAREALLSDYDPEALHRLRVSVRRVRGHLAHVEGKPARKLRRDLKRLVAQTNDARDWDTLRDRLAGPHHERFAALLPAVTAFQSRAHAKVETMLRTQAWSEALEAWESLRHLQPQISSPGESTVHEVAVRFLRARDIALESDSIDAWHRLRIATKDLRYCLDELASSGTVDDDVLQGITVCQQLQDDLGAWHDTVVHLELLKSLRGTNGTAGAERAQAQLDDSLRTEGKHCLQRAVARIRQHRDLLLSLAVLG
jgi:CHAD domain-containing protein